MTTDSVRAGAQSFPELADIKIAGNRRLPKLLFITNRAALGNSIGWFECEVILAALREGGHLLYDDLPTSHVPGPAVAAVQQRLRSDPGIEGVVIIGGYDVVPSVRLDCLPTALRRRVRDNNDADDFIVWSDDAYGDRDGNRGLELPVSRIPDGKSASLVLSAIQCTDPASPGERRGVRNIARPFADAVYDEIPGVERVITSAPATFDQEPAIVLDAANVYLMLHGAWYDSTRFWGTGTPYEIEAINIDNVPDRCQGVVFTGCCWGALIVDTPANRVVTGRSWGFGPKTPQSSMALSFLLSGAKAFIGCTGSHYSPTIPPYKYFGGPLHSAFWKATGSGLPPAEALREAKRQYAWDMPHGQETPTLAAIEFKILRQYTCLGLGW